jgi:hypothetical protein
VAAAERGADEIAGAVAATGTLTASTDEAGELVDPVSPVEVSGEASVYAGFGDSDEPAELADSVLLLAKESCAVEGTATVERLRFFELDPLGALEPLLVREAGAEAGESFVGVGVEMSPADNEEPRPPAEPADDAISGAADRVVRRDGALVVPDGECSDEVAPTEPAEPVVSANASGVEATAVPIPSATARAPTRPT